MLIQPGLELQSFSGNFLLRHVYTSSGGKEMNSNRPAATFFLETGRQVPANGVKKHHYFKASQLFKTIMEAMRNQFTLMFLECNDLYLSKDRNGYNAVSVTSS